MTQRIRTTHIAQITQPVQLTQMTPIHTLKGLSKTHALGYTHPWGGGAYTLTTPHTAFEGRRALWYFGPIVCENGGSFVLFIVFVLGSLCTLGLLRVLRFSYSGFVDCNVCII